MNHREDLEIKLQKITLAIQEVIEDVKISENERQLIVDSLLNYKKEILHKSYKLCIELDAA